MLEGLRRKSPLKLDVRTPISLPLLNRLIHCFRRPFPLRHILQCYG
jgi:hypothetical protein